MHILIVEDEVRLAEALGHILKEQKYKVDIVNDGHDGLEYALSGIYDLLLLDIMLPKINGFEIASERLQQMEHQLQGTRQLQDVFPSLQQQQFYQHPNLHICALLMITLLTF